MTKKNKQTLAGVLLGILIPIIGAILLKYILGFFPKFTAFRIINWNDVFQNNFLLSTFIQFGVLLNLITFFILKWKKQLQIQTGLVLPTMVFIFLAMLFKFYF